MVLKLLFKPQLHQLQQLQQLFHRFVCLSIQVWKSKKKYQPPILPLPPLFISAVYLVLSEFTLLFFEEICDFLNYLNTSHYNLLYIHSRKPLLLGNTTRQMVQPKRWQVYRAGTECDPPEQTVKTVNW